MIHWLVDDWSINEINAYIDCKEVYDWAKYKRMVPEMIMISDIAYVSLNDPKIYQEGSRYINAEISLPGIVVKGMENPNYKPYRMIDGRHRILKSLNNNIMEVKVYVLERYQALKFIKYN